MCRTRPHHLASARQAPSRSFLATWPHQTLQLVVRLVCNLQWSRSARIIWRWLSTALPDLHWNCRVNLRSLLRLCQTSIHDFKSLATNKWASQWRLRRVQRARGSRRHQSSQSRSASLTSGSHKAKLWALLLSLMLSKVKVVTRPQLKIPLRVLTKL